MKYVKSIVQIMYPRITYEEIKSILANLTKYDVGRKKEISEQERIVLDLLLQHQMKPATAYNYYRVLNLPAYLQEEIRQRNITMNEAFHKNLESNRTFEVLADELRRDIITYVSELAKKDFLRGDDYAIIN
jgi:hypothetical protein